MKRTLSIFVFVLLCGTSSVFAQEISKTYCMSAVEYTGSIDGLKEELLAAAKLGAVGELFGEFISSFTKVENLTITEDIIQATSLGFIRIKGDPEYYNGKNLGEVCVKINAYATEEDFTQFQPQTLTQKSCIMEGNVKTIKQDTEKKAIFEALINYDRRLEAYSLEQVLPLLREVTFSDEGFVPETEVYCAKATGIMYPIEVMGTLVVQEEKKDIKEEEKEEEISKQQKTEFAIDLTQYEHGDIPMGLGQNLVIGQTKKGEKYIQALTVEPLGELEIDGLSLSDRFELIIQADWDATSSWDNFSQTLFIMSGTGEEIEIAFEKSKDKSGSEIIFGDVRKHYYYARTAWKEEANVNEIKVVVNGQMAKLFINNKIFNTIFVNSNVIYNTVIVKGLRDFDRIYGLSVKNL